MAYTIGKLAALFGISRSTLLYYDSVDLFKPSFFMPNGYRYYSEEKTEELRRIMELRKSGFSVAEIKEIMKNPGFIPDAETMDRKFGEFLDGYRRINDMNKSMNSVVGPGFESVFPIKDIFVHMLESSGMDENRMEKFHSVFEAEKPEIHEVFLTFLGMDEEEVNRLREFAKKSSVK